MAALACACGCGHRVMLNLLDQHQLVIKGGLPTVTPSILVSDARCLSHFFIRRGQVEWAQQWSEKRGDMVMQSQVRRHVEQDKKRKPKPSFLSRCVDWFASWYDRQIAPCQASTDTLDHNRSSQPLRAGVGQKRARWESLGRPVESAAGSGHSGTRLERQQRSRPVTCRHTPRATVGT
ncbi:DUF6527 family protein [Paraburkholderia sacchari]|uniref:DUF6527 family protein n=1 Tax=Paraburkholderia sacchari TaxID=159450 RepID=UPI0039A5D462